MKSIKAKTGEYTKDGKQVGRYADIGVILSNQNGEYVILNPTVSLSGVLLKQQWAAIKAGKEPRDSVIASIFDNSQQRQTQLQPQQQAPQTSNPIEAQDIPF